MLNILHSPFSILHSPFFILHFSFFILHSSFFILHFSFFILHSSFFILHSSFSILHSSYVIFDTSYFIFIQVKYSAVLYIQRTDAQSGKKEEKRTRKKYQIHRTTYVTRFNTCASLLLHGTWTWSWGIVRHEAGTESKT